MTPAVPGPPAPLDPALLAPLDPEQALHLLDGLTWLPADGPDRWRRVADHLAARLPDRPAPAPRDCRDAARALAAALGGPAAEGGAPAGTAALYRAKYDLIALLHPDPWFTFLNMGHCTAGPDGPDRCADPELPGTGRHGGALYDLTAAPAPLEGAAVLDVGCGRGGGTARLARTRRPRTVTGLDASPRNVAHCRRDHAAPGLSFRYGEADRLPFPDASFDAVVSVESVHCFPDPGRFLAEAARVLRPGGHLLLADEWPAADVHGPARAATAAGLRVEAVEDVTAGVLRSLERLPAEAARLLPTLDGARRDSYARFFADRVGRDSAGLYRSGRCVYLRVHARRQG
ncbi:class I SAM-dependent methyltransferase [Streptomyces sp. NRRL B-24484]|uniref:class I SAM-dependent methyltransferase n=1 Tax=Streptomyces sp. NRRL B-24484 TaxID=1463833 RepID=UPI0006943A57|nr:class I SAM-dependent methyltransferase [Streptomyces sp. NRRL B-24484]